MTRYKNVGLHPEELVGGVMIGPGETVDLSGENETDNQRLVDEGIFMPLDEEESKKKTAKKEES